MEDKPSSNQLLGSDRSKLFGLTSYISESDGIIFKAGQDARKGLQKSVEKENLPANKIPAAKGLLFGNEGHTPRARQGRSQF